jgi:hypothetical protein
MWQITHSTIAPPGSTAWVEAETGFIWLKILSISALSLWKHVTVCCTHFHHTLNWVSVSYGQQCNWCNACIGITLCVYCITLSEQWGGPASKKLMRRIGIASIEQCNTQSFADDSNIIGMHSHHLPSESLDMIPGLRRFRSCGCLSSTFSFKLLRLQVLAPHNWIQIQNNQFNSNKLIIQNNFMETQR